MKKLFWFLTLIALAMMVPVCVMADEEEESINEDEFPIEDGY